MQDPNRGEDFTCGLFRELIDGMAYVGKRNHIRKMDPQVPLLLISGDQDPVGQSGSGVKKVAEQFRRAGVRDVTVRLYPGGRHEMFNEINRDEVDQELAAWLASRI